MHKKGVPFTLDHVPGKRKSPDLSSRASALLRRSPFRVSTLLYVRNCVIFLYFPPHLLKELKQFLGALVELLCVFAFQFSRFLIRVSTQRGGQQEDPREHPIEFLQDVEQKEYTKLNKCSDSSIY